MKTLESLLRTLDETSSPPTTPEECAAWAERWQAVEAAAYDNPMEGARRAAVLVTPQEIASILQTRKFRKEGGRLLAPRWALVKKGRRPGRGMPVDTASVNGALTHLLISSGTVSMRGLDQFDSVDVRAAGGKVVRLVFQDGGRGDRKLSRNSLVRCVALKDFFREKGVQPGRYAMHWVSPWEAEVDLGKRGAKAVRDG